jgi:hypothetical protein
MAREVHKFIPDDETKTEQGKWIGEFDWDGTLRQILVVPETPNTMYDFGIKDEGGMVIFSELDHRGFLATGNLNLIVFPGEKTIVIENATKDEQFKVKLVYQL